MKDLLLVLLCYLLSGGALAAESQILKEGEATPDGLICHGGILVIIERDLAAGQPTYGCDFDKERVQARTKFLNEQERARREREYDSLKKRLQELERQLSNNPFPQ